MNELPRILYEDNHLLVVVKPPNMRVQGDQSGDPNLLDVMKEYVRVKYQKSGAAYLGLVHRLDRPVGGAVVLARTSKAAARLSAQLRERTLGRAYQAKVSGTPPERFTLVHWLLKDPASNTVRVVPEGTPNAKEAILEGETIERDLTGGYSLVHIRLLTGRSHQIRVQLAHSGHPIIGDRKYGRIHSGDLALWAYELTLTHPTTKQTMTFCCPPPWADTPLAD